MAYLRSVFPGQFAPTPMRRGRLGGAGLPRWSFDSAAAETVERAELFAGSYQFVGDQRAILRPGAYLALDIGSERAMVIRDESGVLRAFRNSCPDSPHELTTGYCGHWPGAVECRVHGRRFRYDGGLGELMLRLTDDWIWVRGGGGPPRAPAAAPGTATMAPRFYGTGSLDPHPGGVVPGPIETVVLANWKIVVEQWLAAGPGWRAAAEESEAHAVGIGTAPGAAPEPGMLVADAERLVGDDRWSARIYRMLAGIGPETPWRRRFIAPNQLIERRPDGVTIFQALPTAPGRTTVRTFDYPFREYAASAAALRYLARRLTPERRRAGVALAESVHHGIAAYGYAAETDSPGPGVAAFHDWLFMRMASLRHADPPGEPRQSPAG